MPMTTDRKFMRLSRTATAPKIDEIPEGGICLSSFVVLSKPGEPESVVMGRLNTNAPWDHIGALDSVRAETNSKGWMLPSSHLLLHESPQAAATRILNEQLHLTEQTLDGPFVFSEVYGQKNHWDLEFIFVGERNQIEPCEPWRDLRFVDLRRVKKEEISRSHEDILAHVGKWKPASA